jgi:glycosyltransferase involved in cell wall biosynthesis
MKPKILFYGVSSHLGGAERSLLDFLIYYKASQRPYDFFTLLPKNEGPLIDKLNINNISYSTIAFPYFWLRLSRQSLTSLLLFLIFGLPGYFLYLFKLLFFLRKQPLLTIHSTGIKCHITLCLLSPFLKTHIIIHFRDLMSSKALQRFFLIFKNKKNIEWITASHAISQTFPKLPTEVVYCGFGENQYFAQRNHFLHDLLKIPHHHKLIGMVGVYARWKGQREFILAANIALRELSDHHFLIIGGQIYDTLGEKGYTQDLRQLVSALNREEHIHFVPFQKQPQVVYNSLDLITHCSIEPEPFGRVIVEGIFCEVPMIASAAGGALEIIKDESYGLLHQPGDYEDLAKKILQSLRDPERWEKAQIAAVKTRQDYGLEARFSLLKKIVEKAPRSL